MRTGAIERARSFELSTLGSGRSTIVAIDHDVNRCGDRDATPARPPAERDAELEPNQRQILDALRDIGLEGLRVLDVGCGKGRLHPGLLEAGAASVVGVELVALYVEQARKRANSAGLDDRITYLEGDFTMIADRLEPADVTILDKAVHCYRDPERLVRRAAEHTRSVCVLTFPRDLWWFRWLLRTVAAVVRCLPKPLRPSWRVRFTRPDVIRSWMREAGFVRLRSDETAIFVTEVYGRPR